MWWFPLLAVQLGIREKTKCFLRNHLRETALFKENKMAPTVVSENHPDEGIVSEADIDERGCVEQPQRRCSKSPEVHFC